MTTTAETEPRAQKQSADPTDEREQSIARINTLLPKCSPAFLRGVADEISAHQSETAGNNDPPEKRAAIEKIVDMLPEFDPAFVARLADRLKEEFNVQPPTEPPTGCDEIPTLAECKRIKALYPKINLNHENFWFSLCDAFLETNRRHGWAGIVDVAEFVERWKPGSREQQQTQSGSREQLAAIACASEALDKVSCLHAAASKLLEEHATGSGGEPTMSERDCTTLDYLLNSADDVVEAARGKLAKYNIELMGILDEEPAAT